MRPAAKRPSLGGKDAPKIYKRSLRSFLAILGILIVTLTGCQAGSLPENSSGQAAPSKAAATSPTRPAKPAPLGQESSPSSPTASKTLPPSPSLSGLEQARQTARYLHSHGKLPPFYITKNQALKKGWKSEQGDLWKVTERASIGGDRFYNREGRLPERPGRRWYECDIGYQGGFRSGQRLLYSDDGLFYYTPDHYQTFQKIDLKGAGKWIRPTILKVHG